MTRAAREIFRRHQDHPARLAAVSALFLDARYQLSPLGEGKDAGIDADPLVRYDAFDCVTYVEQVMALSWHSSHRASKRVLQQVRYASGQVAYAQRNHIMMAQWIPQNIAAGFVVDITEQLAGKKARLATLLLDHAAFESDKGRALAFTREQRPLGEYAVAIIPIDDMLSIIETVPHGTIITSIRAARRAVPYRASHVGLIVVRDGKRYIRHAHAPSVRVIEQPLKEFVVRSRRFRKWPVSGFNLLRIAAMPRPLASMPRPLQVP